MSDPRLAALVNLLETRYSHSPERAREWAGDILPLIDAADPLRQPPSDAAVYAGLDAWFGPEWRRWENAHHFVSRMRRNIVAVLGVMRGETDPKPAVIPADDRNPPPDAVDDRLAALEARPQFTAEKADLLQYLAGTAMMTFDKTIVRRIIVEKLNAAFPINTNPPTADLQPERAWPPKDCLLAVLRQDRKSPCAVVRERLECPHAGERA